MTDKEKIKEIQKVIDEYNKNDLLPSWELCMMEIEYILNED